jgi:hypothetical protein
VLRLPGTHPRSLIGSLPGSTLTSSVRVSQLALALPDGRRGLPGRGQCSTGDPITGLLSRGRERDLPGAQAIHPVPLPRSRTPAESTIPRLLTVSSMLPPLVRQRRLQRINHIGAIARLQHLLPTLQEWCRHHPCKARFRLTGSPLPGGSRTLWIAIRGFTSHSRSSSSGFILAQRTAGFPRYGSKAGLSDMAYPAHTSVKLAPSIPVVCSCLPPSFVLSVAAWILRSESEVTCSVDHRHASDLSRSTPGALAPVRVMLSRPIYT